jgi:hypothetical protein
VSPARGAVDAGVVALERRDLGGFFCELPATPVSAGAVAPGSAGAVARMRAGFSNVGVRHSVLPLSLTISARPALTRSLKLIT